MSPVFKTLQEMKSVFTPPVKVEKIHHGVNREHNKASQSDFRQLLAALGVNGNLPLFGSFSSGCDWDCPFIFGRTLHFDPVVPPRWLTKAARKPRIHDPDTPIRLASNNCGLVGVRCNSHFVGERAGNFEHYRPRDWLHVSCTLCHCLGWISWKTFVLANIFGYWNTCHLCHSHLTRRSSTFRQQAGSTGRVLRTRRLTKTLCD